MDDLLFVNLNVFFLMSVNKLQSFLDRPSKCPPTDQKVILLSDSRGRYLEPYKKARWNIEFVYKSGARLAQGYYWLECNIRSLVQQYDTIHLFKWLGTCDLTQKFGPYIRLRHSSLEECFQCITCHICQFYKLVDHYPTVILVFLEIPPYSIVKWYEHKHLVIPDGLSEQNFELLQLIGVINEFIQEKNDCFGVGSPRFKLDLHNTRKVSGKSGRRSISFKHYLDGVHPDNLLSCVWLKRLMECSFYISDKSLVY